MLNPKMCKLLVGMGTLAVTLGPATPARAQVSKEPAAQLSQNADQHVIVILKSQQAPVHKDSSEAARRSAAIDVDQAPLMDELRQVHATNIKKPPGPRPGGHGLQSRAREIEGQPCSGSGGAGHSD